MRSAVFLAAWFLLFPASHAVADFYRWVDKDGNEFFSNERKQVPAEYQDSATLVRPDESRVRVSERPLPSGAAVVIKEHKDKNGRGEKCWRKRAARLRIKLRKEQDKYDLVLKQLDDQEQKQKHVIHKKRKSRSGLEKKKLKLEKKIAAVRRELEVELPEEARKADAYPGWLRE